MANSMTKDLLEEIQTAEERINSWKNLIRVTRTNRDNPEFYNRSRAELVTKIDLFQKQLAELDDSHNRADEIIENAMLEIQRLKKFVVTNKNRAQIDRMKKLMAELNELQAEVGDIE